MNNPKMDKPIVLFDGVCNLCNGLVQFIIKRDPSAHIRFTALQSPTGQALLKRFELPADNFDTFVLVENNRVYLRSTGALRTVRYFSGLWPVLFAGIVLPKFFRDFIYKQIANNRYKWFGKKAECMMPTENIKQRFLDYEYNAS